VKGREGEERERKTGEGRRRGGRGRDGTRGHRPQYFIAPPFQFSRNMPATKHIIRTEQWDSKLVRPKIQFLSRVNM